MSCVKVWRVDESGDGRWWVACLCYDNEAAGFIERQLVAAGFKVLVQQVATVGQPAG